MTLTELLQNRFRADLRHRGAAYLEAERVSLNRVTPENVFGVVVDGVEHQTQLRYQENDIALFCTCDQFARTGACKHLWATILTADLKGHIDPSVRPGRLVPFVVHTAASALIPDSGSPEDDRDSDFWVSQRRTAQLPEREVHLKAWEKRLEDLREDITAGQNGTGTHSQDRRIFYQIDLNASREAGKLVIQASQRQRRSSGQWGKTKPLKIRPGEVDQIEHEDDRTYLSYLAGAVPERSNWSNQQAELRAAAHRFHVPYELGRLILPEMCRAGRLTLQGNSDADDQVLEWDSGPPWELTVRVKRDTESAGWSLFGQVIRDTETLELADVQLVVTGGFVVSSGRLSLLNDFAAPQWLTMLTDERRVVISSDDEQDFVDRLLDIPSLPRLELPPELQLEEVTAEPSPGLKIFTPAASSWRGGSLTAEVVFDYLGTPVAGRHSRWAVVQREQNRCILRDRSFEDRCWQRLRELGFRKRLNVSQAAADVEIPRRDLAQAVRQLIEDGWSVCADGSQVRQAGGLQFRVRSNIDWFDLNANIDFEGHKVEFPELLRTLDRGDSIVRLDDGSLGILPEEWLEQIGMISGLGTRDGSSLRFSNSQAALLDALLASQKEVEFDLRFEELRDRLRSFAGVERVNVPRKFIGELRDYQKDGLSWMTFLREFSLGGCLADDMGLGKTVQFIAMLVKHRSDRKKQLPSIVVVPRSLIFNWHAEFGRFAPQIKVMEYTGLERATLRSQFAKTDVILTTYGTVRRDVNELKDVDFDYIVLDEAQTIKNSASQIARASRLLRGRYRLALSGTPIENNAGDLWSIFEFLNPGMLGRSSAFRRHVADPESENTRDLVARGLKPFILRRTKEQVASELPQRLEETIFCEMDDDQRRLYDELRVHYRDSLLGLVEKNGLAKNRMHVLEALLRLRQAACHPALLNRGDESDAFAKLEFLIPHLKELVAENHKSLVFSQFTSMLSIVRHHLDELGINYEYLDGQTRDRKMCVTRFQEDPDCRIFLISLKAGGLGLNLTAAEYVFLLDPWWNPAVEAQAIDRAHRVGQTRTVFAYRLICRDTVEEKILQLQQKKRALADAILDGADRGSILKDMSLEDLELLLS